MARAPSIILFLQVEKVQSVRVGWMAAQASLAPGTGPADNGRVAEGQWFSVVGDLGPDVGQGASLQVSGVWEDRQKHGRQFFVRSATPLIGASEAGLAAFLRRLPQIGPVRAKQVIEACGGLEATLKALASGDTTKLLSVSGINEARAQEIVTAYKEQQEVIGARMYLGQLQLTDMLITRAIAAWDRWAGYVVAEDPYALMDLYGCGFKTADEIARRMGLGPNDDRRCLAAIRMGCEFIEDRGDTYASELTMCGVGGDRVAWQLRDRTDLSPDRLAYGLYVAQCQLPPRLHVEWRGRDKADVQRRLAVARNPRPPIIVREVVQGERYPRIYPTHLWRAEVDAARHVVRLLTSEVRPRQNAGPPVDFRMQERVAPTPQPVRLGQMNLPLDAPPRLEPAAPVEVIDRPRPLGPLRVQPEVWGDMVPAAEQQRALELAATAKVLVVCGGPGSGKSQTMRAVVDMLEANGLSVALCALSATAAKRLGDFARRPGKTIHRLLAFGKGENGEKFFYGEKMPLSYDCIVTDECSLLDNVLFTDLVSAIPDGGRLIMVGDGNQLPAIGAGQVLIDLIASGVVPVVELVKIFRQPQVSGIPWAARAVREGRVPDFRGLKDVKFTEANSPDEIVAAVVELLTQILPRANPSTGRRAYTAEEVQVICAQKAELFGVVNLNKECQSALNATLLNKYDRGEAASMWIGAGDYRVRARVADKIRHFRNNYEIFAYNGDIGYIRELDNSGLDVKQLREWSVDGLEYAVYEDRPTSDEEDEDGDNKPRSHIEVERGGRTNCVLVADYDDRRIAYRREDVEQLQLAYAQSLHASQGGQWPVIIAIFHEDHRLADRAWTYTCLTRAREFVIVLGQWSAFTSAIQRTARSVRQTSLAERLVAAFQAAQAKQQLPAAFSQSPP